MTKVYSYALDSFSDLHKDAYGFRPSGDYWKWLTSASQDEIQEEWDSLLVSLDFAIKQQESDEEYCLNKLNILLGTMMSDHKIDIETAIRWLHDANKTNGDNMYLDFCMGVKYGTISAKLGLKFKNQPCEMPGFKNELVTEEV